MLLLNMSLYIKFKSIMTYPSSKYELLLLVLYERSYI